MVEVNPSDQGDRLAIREPVAKPLEVPDAQVARMSGHVEMSKVEKNRTNASDGSLRHYQPTNQANSLPADWEEQNTSLELQDGDISISRSNKLKEADLVSGSSKNSNGKPYAVYTKEASPAIRKLDPISQVLTQGYYQESVKQNAQITNVPEVSPGVKTEDLLGFTNAVLDAGAKAVRPVEEHLAKPNVINEDTAAITNKVIEAIDKPMMPDQRAVAAGSLLPMFFFEGGGKPLDNAAAKQMNLDQMTAEQLKMLGIERAEMNMPEIPPELMHLPLTKAEPRLQTAVESKGHQIEIAEPNYDLARHLENVQANASVFDSRGEPEIVAWDPIKWAGAKAGEVKEAAAKSAEKAWYPFRGKEDSQVDYSACANAYKAFPEFAKHPNIDRALIPALIRNELHFYNAKEGPIEGVLNTFGDLPSDSLSVGPAQMKQSNIERLMVKFPQLSSPEHGGITGNPTKAALEPAKAPWFVAAYLAEQIQSHDSAKLPVTHQELIQKYNPGGRVHYNHVHEQLIWIKTNHASW